MLIDAGEHEQNDGGLGQLERLELAVELADPVPGVERKSKNKQDPAHRSIGFRQAELLAAVVPSGAGRNRLWPSP